MLQAQPAVLCQRLMDETCVEQDLAVQVAAVIPGVIPALKPDAYVVFGHELAAADIVRDTVAVPVVGLAPAGNLHAVELAELVPSVQVNTAGNGQAAQPHLQFKAGPALFSPEGQLHQLSLAAVPGTAV